ncbi:hypothetical protein LEM8419_02969 [Neolewinella maritima]|uniref:Uncharacterized protein n=1 Tax=Neolewinella maritima TaxID=1383882 RepID=A0ABN8FCP3_9BACT|nr:hypothetical protein [Neolewinella maritima]CAH1002054.1 hypothetical protein LEM8419_02969 [Neolewinella maritima]
MPYLAFPQILGGTGPIAYLVLAGIVALVVTLILVFYRFLSEEP